MSKPMMIWKGGRPRKAGPREASGRPARDVPVPPPCTEQDGLARSAADYRVREVTERGQVIGRTVAVVGVLDKLPVGNGPRQIDGDEMNALSEYERRHAACMVSVKCHLDRTPGSGDGLAGVVDNLRRAIDARNKLRFALLPTLWAHVEAVFEEKEQPDIARMKNAAGLLLRAMDGRKNAA